MALRLVRVLGSGASAFRVFEADGRVEIRGRNRVIRGNRDFDQLVEALVADDTAAALESLADRLSRSPAELRAAVQKLIDDLERGGLERTLWQRPDAR